MLIFIHYIYISLYLLLKFVKEMFVYSDLVLTFFSLVPMWFCKRLRPNASRLVSQYPWARPLCQTADRSHFRWVSFRLHIPAKNHINVNMRIVKKSHLPRGPPTGPPCLLIILHAPKMISHIQNIKLIC